MIVGHSKKLKKKGLSQDKCGSFIKIDDLEYAKKENVKVGYAATNETDRPLMPTAKLSIRPIG